MFQCNVRRMLNGATLAIAMGAAAVMLLPATSNASLIANGDFSANAGDFTKGSGAVDDSAYPASEIPIPIQNWETSNTGLGLNGLDTQLAESNQLKWAPVNMGDVRNFVYIQFGTRYIQQTVSTNPGQLYELSYKGARADEHHEDRDPAGVIKALILDADDGNAVVVSQIPTINYQQFQNFSLQFTAPSDSITVKFINVVGDVDGGGNASKPGEVDIADVSLRAVPEPGSLSLLGLSGLVLTGRRRKPN